MNYYIKLLKNHYLNYKAPIQLNYAYSFGSASLIILGLQIVSGLFLALRYNNSTEYAFSTLQFFIYTSNLGYFFQTLHSTGASIFLIIIFLHLVRNLWYKLYKNEHTIIWCSGIIILVLVMLAAFTGYILPWGQMSYWAATVIFNFFSIIPIIGPKIVTLLFGGEIVGQATLSRIYVIHFLVPFIILLLAFIHLMFLHKKGSTILYNYHHTNISLKKFLIKDLSIFLLILNIYIIIIYIFPNLFLDFLNLEKANSMVTPKHIKPEWYFMPFYGMLKTIPHKAGGIICMAFSIIILLLVPWISKFKEHFIQKFSMLILFYKLIIKNNKFILKFEKFFYYYNLRDIITIKLIRKLFIIENKNNFVLDNILRRVPALKLLYLKTTININYQIKLYNYFNLSWSPFKIKNANYSQLTRKLLIITFLVILISLGFFNDLEWGSWYIVLYFGLLLILV